MAKWIITKEEKPPIKSKVVVEHWNGDVEKILYSGKIPDWWDKHIKQWLKEDNTISFSIGDMEKCWDKCNQEHSERSDRGLPKKLFNDFIKEQYNINL